MKRVGLFGGTFNPVHQGHIGLAQWLLAQGLFNEIWLTLSPQNPLRESARGASDDDRRQMLVLACEGIAGLKPCFVEYDMPRPSYTIDTLLRLSRDYPDTKFSLIIGSDNWQIFDRWKDSCKIIEEFGVIVYPRNGYALPPEGLSGVTAVADAPEIEISSTEIRQELDMHSNLIPDKVLNYIKVHHLYDTIDQTKQ